MFYSTYGLNIASLKRVQLKPLAGVCLHRFCLILYLMSSFIIYIDSWCPMCVCFGSWLKRLDIFNAICQADIRTYEGSSISKEKGLDQLASINRHSRVFYGYDTIWQILVRLPLLWVFFPVFYILKVSRLGHWAYKELAIKRQIIPLHCKEEDCRPN